MSLALRQFPSHINQELNLEPPAAMDHAEDEDSDDDDDENGRYELWTFRIPVGMNLSDLHGVELPPESIAGKPTLSATKSGKKLTIEPGETVENETFRLLVPSNAKDGSSGSSDDDDDSDNDNTNDTSNYLLHPSSKKFKRHFNVFENLPPKPSEAELAPAEGPAPTGCVLKRAYSHIPQRTNLKRRWMPPGNQSSAIELPESLITMKPHGTADAKPSSRKTNNNDDDDDDSQGAAVDVMDTKPSATKPKKSKPSSAKRRRTTDDKATTKTESSPVVSPPKKKRTKTEKKASKKAKKQAKKDKKRRHSTGSSKREDDAISV